MKSAFIIIIFFILNLLSVKLFPSTITPECPHAPVTILHQQHNLDFSDIDQDWKRYLFETAIVKTVQKVVQAGIELLTETVIYIRDYGREEARYIKETRTISMLNRTEVTSKRTIMTMDKLVTILEDGTVHIMENPAGDLMKSMTEEKAQQFGQNILKGLDAKVEDMKSEQIAGQSCKCTKSTTDMAGMKMEAIQCAYKQYPFLIKSTGMGMNSEERVTEFKEGVKIDNKHFEYPSN